MCVDIPKALGQPGHLFEQRHKLGSGGVGMGGGQHLKVKQRFEKSNGGGTPHGKNKVTMYIQGNMKS